MKILLYIIIILLLIIIALLFFKKYEYENFENDNKKVINDTSYLYPIKKLGPICEKDNLKSSFMPKACYVDGNLNPYANCKCEDEKGNCKICYPEIKKDSKNSSVIYNANDMNSS
jgi:hypothetical protein